MKYAEMAISVTDLNKYIKNKIADDEYLNNILIKGEISNFKHHYTGHLYFTLKDENSLIKCIMFKSYAQKLNFEPKDGMKVYILGSVSVFERDGAYQIYCRTMTPEGLGELYLAYEQLKDKLNKEGLFDSATVYKRGEPDPEPFYSTEQIPTESQDTIHIYKLREFETPSEAVVFGRAEFSDEILGKFNSEYAIIYNVFSKFEPTLLPYVEELQAMYVEESKEHGKKEVEGEDRDD